MSEELGDVLARVHHLNQTYKKLSTAIEDLGEKLDDLKSTRLERWTELEEHRPRTPLESLEAELDRLIDPLRRVRDEIVERATDEYNRAVEEAEQAYNGVVESAEEEFRVRSRAIEAEFEPRFALLGDDGMNHIEHQWPELDSLDAEISEIDEALQATLRERLQVRHELNDARNQKSELIRRNNE